MPENHCSLFGRLKECPVLLYLAEEWILSFVDLEKVIHAFISSKLDYCSLLYCGINCKASSQLQLVSKCSSYAPDRPTKQGSYLSCVGVISPAHWKEVTLKSCRLFIKLCMVLQHSIFHSSSYATPLRSLGRLIRGSKSWIGFECYGTTRPK